MFRKALEYSSIQCILQYHNNGVRHSIKRVKHLVFDTYLLRVCYTKSSTIHHLGVSHASRKEVNVVVATFWVLLVVGAVLLLFGVPDFKIANFSTRWWGGALVVVALVVRWMTP